MHNRQNMKNGGFRCIIGFRRDSIRGAKNPRGIAAETKGV